MAMTRPRRPSFRTQPSFRPVYQDFKPKYDMTENPEAHVLLIHLPGFTKERIRVQYDDSSQLVRVSGERPIDGGNRRSRFREAYPVPQNCNINKIQSSFRQGMLTIIMPKNIITQAEVKPTQEQALAGSPTQRAEQAIPPNATTQETRDDQKTASSPPTSGTGPGDMKATPSIDSQKPDKELTVAVAEKKADSVPQKVREENEPKATLKLDQGNGEDEKANYTIVCVHWQYVAIAGQIQEIEHTERRRFVTAGEHSAPKIPEKGNETTRKAEPAGQSKEWNLNDGMIGTIGKGIKEVTTSAPQSFTRIAEGKWDNQDKPLLSKIVASILVLAAVGGYALYKFTSS